MKFQSKETIESLSALEIAEQMTYLDHEIFVSIRSEYVVFFSYSALINKIFSFLNENLSYKVSNFVASI